MKNYTLLPFDSLTEKKLFQLATEIELAPGRAADTLIAAGAKAHKLKIVTANIRDFKRLPGIELIEYRIDWSNS